MKLRWSYEVCYIDSGVREESWYLQQMFWPQVIILHFFCLFFFNVHVWGIIWKAPALGILSLPSCVEFPVLSDIGKADPRVRSIFPFSCLLGFPIFLSASREVGISDYALTMDKSGPYEPSKDF